MFKKRAIKFFLQWAFSEYCPKSSNMAYMSGLVYVCTIQPRGEGFDILFTECAVNRTTGWYWLNTIVCT